MKVLLYEGLEFTLPEMPKFSDIQGYRLPKSDQKWFRTPLPENWDYLSPEEQEAFAEEEDRKSTEGTWFYNNGVPTYITGDHYFYLNWFKIDAGYPQYRDRDRRWFYHWRLCELSDDCIGQCYGKLRRDGYSYRVDSMMLNSARRSFDSNFGIVSKTGEDAREMFKKLVHGFQSLPDFFKPQVQSAEDVKKELVFKTPQQKITYKTRKVKKELSLNTLIDWKATKENAYDGTKQKRLAADECFGFGTKILCEGFVFKEIQDIVIGDKVIVEGGKCIEVANVLSGFDDLYLIKQPYGKSYVCNSSHRLYLEHRDRGNEVLKITPNDYLSFSKYKKRTTYRVIASEMNFKEVSHIIPSYLIGVWLGDGSKNAFKIIVNLEKDIEIYNEIIRYANNNSIDYAIYDSDSKCCKYIYLKSDSVNLLSELRRLNIMNNKHIPSEYLLDSIDNRLNLLAGLVDTDGYISDRGYIEFAFSSKQLILDVQKLCGSLGLSVSNIKEKKSNFNTIVYRIFISGDLKKIPTRVKRKFTGDYVKQYESRRCKMDVEKIGVGAYYGITLKTTNDDDRRLILEDYTLSMNCGKWEECNVEKWYNIAKTCVMLGGRIIGKIAFGSTVNESEKGGSNFKAIWDKSNYRELNANGRTVSGLWRYFVPAYDGLEGFIDEYGMSVIDTPEVPVMGIDGVLIKIGAKQYLENERKSKYDAGDIVGYYEEMRQRPFTEEEMFRDPANERTQFDIDKIYQQIDHNVWIKNSIVRGNFVWKDGVRDSEVVWQEDSNGKWLMYWMPKPEDRNKHTMKYNQKAPANTHEGLFGVDPYDHKYTTSNKQSKAASHGLHKLSFNCPEASNAFVTQYWYRPNDPTILYEDMLMQCYFYGWEILGESNKPGCINHFRNRGYENYLMDRPAFTHTEYSKERQKEKWIPNTGDADRGIRRMLVETLQSYIYQNVGIDSLTEKMGNCVFDDTLTDWAKFDIDKWTDFDLTVSSMYAVLGASNYTPKKIIRKDPIKLFDVFRVEGASSKLI